MLVNVHIVSGDTSLSEHLKGLTMRVAVLQRLLDILRGSGYPGYDEKGINFTAFYLPFTRRTQIDMGSATTMWFWLMALVDSLRFSNAFDITGRRVF